MKSLMASFAFVMRLLLFIELLSSTTMTTEMPVTASMLVTWGRMVLPSSVSTKSSASSP